MSEEIIPDNKTEYILFHSKEGEIIMGHSPVFGEGEFVLQDVLTLKETYTPMSHIPIVIFSKYVSQSKGWSFRFKVSSLSLIISTLEIQESFILFYEWCRESIMKDQQETIDTLLIDYMISKNVDITKLVQKPEDAYLYSRFIKKPEDSVATPEEVKKEPVIPLSNVLSFNKKKDEPTIH